MSSYDANGDDYVSSYLLRPLRSIKEVLEAREFRGAVAAWKDTHKPTGDDQASFAAGSLTGTVGNGQQPVSSPAYRTTKPSAARRSE